MLYSKFGPFPAGPHIEAPHIGWAEVAPGIWQPVRHAGVSYAAPPHFETPHPSLGPFGPGVHGGPGGFGTVGAWTPVYPWPWY